MGLGSVLVPWVDKCFEQGTSSDSRIHKTCRGAQCISFGFVMRSVSRVVVEMVRWDLGYTWLMGWTTVANMVYHRDVEQIRGSVVRAVLR